MKKSELKNIISECVEEVYVEKSLRESFDYDLQRLNQTLIAEGFFDSTKKIMQSVPAKAKQTLAQPLIYAILDRVKKTDPKGFEQLKQYTDDPNKLNQLINHEKIKQQTDKINKELANAPVNEGDDEFEESFQRYLSEALYRQKTSPKNADTSKNYDWSKSVEDNIPKKEVPKQKYSLKKKDPSVPQKYENPDTFPTPDEISKQNPEKKSEDPSKDKKGISLSNIADKAGILAIKGLGKAGELVGKGISKLAQTDAGKKAGQAGMGIVSKVSSYMKKHPKLTAGVALALIASIGTAAAIGSGGVVPLITSTVTAGAGGALKGGAIGSAIGAGKEMYSQIKGGAKSFKDIDYKKVGKAGLKAGGKGAAIGAAVGAGANVLGKAAAGISKIFSSGQVTSNPNSFLKDLTPEEQRALGIEGKTWAEKFNPDDPNTWKIKPKINSTNGYNIARQENELLYKGITGKDASDIINTKAAAAKSGATGQTSLDAKASANPSAAQPAATQPVVDPAAAVEKPIFAQDPNNPNVFKQPAPAPEPVAPTPTPAPASAPAAPAAAEPDLVSTVEKLKGYNPELDNVVNKTNAELRDLAKELDPSKFDTMKSQLGQPAPAPAQAAAPAASDASGALEKLAQKQAQVQTPLSAPGVSVADIRATPLSDIDKFGLSSEQLAQAEKMFSYRDALQSKIDAARQAGNLGDANAAIQKANAFFSKVAPQTTDAIGKRLFVK